MNILSLFDGLSGGQIALKRLGININKYYASEVDQFAIEVAKTNNQEMNHIGDVRKENNIIWKNSTERSTLVLPTHGDRLDQNHSREIKLWPSCAKNSSNARKWRRSSTTSALK